jgi:hypothetical protein
VRVVVAMRPIALMLATSNLYMVIFDLALVYISTYDAK